MVLYMNNIHPCWSGHSFLVAAEDHRRHSAVRQAPFRLRHCLMSHELSDHKSTEQAPDRPEGWCRADELELRPASGSRGHDG